MNCNVRWVLLVALDAPIKTDTSHCSHSYKLSDVYIE